MNVLAVFVALAAAGVAYQQVGRRRDRRRFPPPGQLLDAGGHRLHVICEGSGCPLVLLESGIAASSLSWAAVRPKIAAFARVCAYDRAGLAWSDAPSSPRSFDRIVDELAAVVDRVAGRGPCVLVGHSFGSFVVRAYAARWPGSVAGLVLVDPPTEWLTVSAERARMLRGGRALSRIGAALAHVGVVRVCLALLTGGAPGAPRGFVRVFGPTAARTLARIVGEVRKLPPDVHPVVQALWCEPKCFRAIGAHLLAFERAGASMAAPAPPRDIPVVVISGGDQPPEQMSAHRVLAAQSAHGRHLVASRSSHWVQFDQPDLIASAVKDLVDSWRARR